MKQHKWHKEIKAWADGAEIESRYIGKDKELMQFKEWSNEEGCDCAWENEEWEYRIKPQPKEPQYLYVYLADEGYHLSRLNPKESKYMEREQVVCIGKIKLEE